MNLPPRAHRLLRHQNDVDGALPLVLLDNLILDLIPDRQTGPIHHVGKMNEHIIPTDRATDESKRTLLKPPGDPTTFSHLFLPLPPHRFARTRRR